jgi:DNA-binding CsgD family transcriptional regulator
MNPWAVAFLVNALVQRGELDEARALIERNGLAGELPEAPFFEPIASARARLAIAAGDPAEALAVARFGELMVKSGTVNPGLSSWRSEAALALAGVGRAAEAHELAQEELRLARTYGAPRPIGAALRTVAKLSAGEQRLDALREAVGVLERSPAQLERAAAHVELGTALRLAGRNQDARYPLRRGRELAMGCGAVALVVQARAELVASGGRPRKDPADGRAALTPSELRVAELASRGNTNREIAESLFVTLRTVELQLTHAYQKLGIASRGELADALREPRGA